MSDGPADRETADARTCDHEAAGSGRLRLSSAPCRAQSPLPPGQVIQGGWQGGTLSLAPLSLAPDSRAQNPPTNTRQASTVHRQTHDSIRDLETTAPAPTGAGHGRAAGPARPGCQKSRSRGVDGMSQTGAPIPRPPPPPPAAAPPPTPPQPSAAAAALCVACW
jgi:hypothetical protein